MNRPFPIFFAQDFEPHPDDAEAVKKLSEKYKRVSFKLNPKGRVWSVRANRMSDLDCSIIVGLPELIEVITARIYGRTSTFTHLGFAKLCTHPKLNIFLDCWNLMLGDEAAIAVGNNTRLRWVHLGGCGVTNKGVRAISQANQLLMLSLFHSEITDDAVPFLSELSNLRRLNIRNTKISKNSAMNLQNRLTRCSIDVLLPEFAG